MTNDPPVDFEALARQPNQKSGGAPLQISSAALMKNFVFATLIIESSWVDNASGIRGHTQRKIKLPPVPEYGIHVLGCKDGEVQWIATESC